MVTPTYQLFQQKLTAWEHFTPFYTIICLQLESICEERSLNSNIDCTTDENNRKYSNRVVCLNSATAAEKLNLRIFGIRPGDKVIVPAYTYTASASAAIHCGAKVVFVDIQKDSDAITHMPAMDYDALEAAITEKTKAIITVDLGGIICDYDRVFEIVERKRNLFKPLDDAGDPLSALSSRIQQAIGRVAIVADCAHSPFGLIPYRCNSLYIRSIIRGLITYH